MPVYRALVDNPMVFDPIRATRGAYWIIYPDTFRTNIQPLVDWKKAKGFDVVTISKRELGTNSYTPMRDSIRNRFDRAQIKPDYIVIIGDVVMPNAYGIATKAYSNPFGFGSIDSDNFFTFLYGNDYFPDVLIGRISIDYASEFTAYLNKLFKYERTPYMTDTDWYLRGTMVAGSDGYSFLSPRMTKLWCRETMMEHGYTEVDTFFSSYSGEVTPEEINASINNGVSYVNYRGYGTADGWVPPTYTSSNIMQLATTQRFSIMTSVVCGTGDFNDTDTGVDVCFGETWIRANNKGGPGFIGNSNHDAHTRWTNAIDVGIYWGLFVQNVTTLAQSELMGKMTLYNAFPGDRGANGEVELYFNSYNDLGDPEVNCWTGVPLAQVVTVADSIPFGQNRVDVLVENTHGDPLEGAVVCLWKQNEIFAVGNTGVEGNYSFLIQPATTGEMRVTVTNRGFIPFEDSINIVSSPLAVGCQSYTIDDDSSGESLGDGNGIMNPSERIELGLTLANYGFSDTAFAVKARISSPMPGITVGRDTAYYASIAPASSGSPDRPFIVNIGAAIPNGAVVPFMFDISDSSGHSWQGIVRIPIEAAQISFDSVSVVLDYDNGQIDPGEMVGLVVHARNVGNRPLINPIAVLRSGDSHVVIFDSLVTLNSIMPGDTSSNSAHPFMIDVDNSVYVGHHLNFAVQFEGQGPQIVGTSFSKTVGTIATHDPIGPDNYGYYCFDNTDSGYVDRPTYNWIDISTAWPSVTLGDDEVATIGLPFQVQYYGQVYDSITICDNGFITFGRTWFANFYNAPIPAPQDPEAMVAPFWDDFTQVPLHVYYHYDTTTASFIIGWRNAYDGDNSRQQTFEIIILNETNWPTLTNDNDIIIQYNIAQAVNTMSAGICSPDRRDGIGYSFNGRYDPGAAPVVAGRAIKFTTGSLYSTAADDPVRPDEFSLSQNYPNPFNASTAIKFDLPQNEHVTIDIFNVLGQKIQTLADDDFGAGSHSVIWNAENSASGVYFYRLTMGDKVVSRRMTLLK